uniref:Uncharacterized protein n=1 Tax=Sus scrofa TaxID=9823 RepID=A0A8D0YAF9_PIG
MVSFAGKKLISLTRFHLFIFAFISIALGDRPKKALVQLMSENILPMFSSRSFMVSCLILKSLSHFEFTFVYGMRVFSNFIDLYAAVQLSQHHLFEETVFIVYFCLLHQRLIVYGFIAGLSLLFH